MKIVQANCRARGSWQRMIIKPVVTLCVGCPPRFILNFEAALERPVSANSGLHRPVVMTT